MFALLICFCQSEVNEKIKAFGPKRNVGPNFHINQCILCIKAAIKIPVCFLRQGGHTVRRSSRLENPIDNEH